MTHACAFPELIVDDEPMLAPCDCGHTPYDHLHNLEREVSELNAATLAIKPQLPLYHWSPTSRRKQISRYGLRPMSRSTTSSERFDIVCFADSASWAWALSGNMEWTPGGEWDLWQTSLDRLHEPVVMPSADRGTGIYEVRTTQRVFKRDIWHVATRTKGNP